MNVLNDIQSLSHVRVFAPHGPQHSRLPCPSLSPWVCSNLCPLSQWCHLKFRASVKGRSGQERSIPGRNGNRMSPLQSGRNFNNERSHACPRGRNGTNLAPKTTCCGQQQLFVIKSLGSVAHWAGWPHAPVCLGKYFPGIIINSAPFHF